MFKATHQGRKARAELGAYVYFVLSTGTYQTFAGWRESGRRNPHVANDYRRDIVTRTEIANLLFDKH